jgi:uncharacterized membrane protein
MPETPNEGTPPAFGLDRIIFFSDAVIAIAITLLVLDLKVPEMSTPAEFGRQVLGQWPKYLGYAVSFWVIALYWVAHHRCFRYIRQYDRRLIYLNFLFLMFIAFMPYPTGLLFNNPQFVSVVLYAGTAAGMGLALTWVWVYAVRHGFLAAGVTRAMIDDIRLNLLLPPVVFLITIVIALFNPDLAMFAWVLLLPIYLFRRRREHAVFDREL